MAPTAARRLGGGPSLPATRARVASTASSGLPSAAATTWSTAGPSRACSERASAPTSPSLIGGDGERADRHAVPGQVGQQLVQLGAPHALAAHQHEQGGQRGEPAADVRGQPQAGAVRAVGVVDREQGRPLGARPLDQPQQRLEHPQPLQLRGGRGRRLLGVAEPGAESGREPVELGRPGGRRRRLPDDRRRGTGPGPATRRTGSRPRRRCRPPGRRGRRAAVDPPGQLGEQGGLADPGLAA